MPSVLLFNIYVPMANRSQSDGQKRPVFIYRFLTTGAIDGTRQESYYPSNLTLEYQRRSTRDK